MIVNSASKKEVQQEILELLKSFDSICRNNNIYYSLHAGTLLGAVREKGFIPWDNDADISMMRSEYIKLLDCIKRTDTSLKVSEFDLIPRVVRKDENVNCPFCWIDIFIYDYITENMILQRIKIYISLVMRLLYRNKEMLVLMQDNAHRKIQIMAAKVACYLGSFCSQEKKRKSIEKFCSSKLTGSKRYIYRSNDYLRGLKIVEPVNYMSGYKDIKFENLILMSMVNTHDVLKNAYGDYMTPVRDRTAEERHQDKGCEIMYRYIYGGLRE